MWLLMACVPPGPGDTAGPGEPSLQVADTTLAVQVGEPLVLTAEASPGQVTWSWEGERREGATVEFIADSPGNRVVVVELLTDEGARRSDTVFVEVYRPPLADRPGRSGTLAVDAAGVAWAVTPEAGLLTRADADGAQAFPVCASPQAVALDDAGVVGVSCDEGLLLRLDDQGRELGRVELGAGSHPAGVVAAGERWWVALAGAGQVVAVEGDAVVHTEAWPDVRGLAVAEGRLYAARFRSVDGAGAVYRLDALPLVLPLHPGPDSDTIAGGVPNLLQAPAVSPDGSTLYVPMLQANVARGLLGSGEPLTFESTVRAALGVVPVDAAEEDWSVRKQLDNQDRVVAVAPSPTGNHLAVAHPGTRTVQVLDAFNLDVVGSLLDAGHGITDLEWRGDVLYVHAALDRRVRAYTMGEPGALPRLLWEATLVEEEPLAEAVLRGKRLFAASGDPRISRDGYIACASCHPDGDHDGMTWDFTSRGEGMRNTGSLLGRGGTDMGWLHWSANFDEVQDFENDIRNAFGGTGLLDDADWADTQDTLGAPKAGRSSDLDALAAYVTSLDRTPDSPYAARATPERAALFEQAGCAECHPAPRYTDSALDALRLHDVGTLTAASGGRLGGELTGLDTPTLLGAWSTGPWLHDGSAPTLEAAIAAHTTLQLAPGEVVELAAYVSAL